MLIQDCPLMAAFHRSRLIVKVLLGCPPLSERQVMHSLGTRHTGLFDAYGILSIIVIFGHSEASLLTINIILFGKA